MQETLPTTYEYHVCKYTENDEGYEAELRVAISTIESAKKWVEEYQARSKVTLRVKTTKPNSGRIILLSTYYRCQHNTRSKSANADQKRSSENTKCPAELSIALKMFMGNKSRYFLESS